MSTLDTLLPLIIGVAESFVVAILILIGLRLADRIYPAASDDDHHYRFKRQITKVLIMLIGLIVLLIVLPISDTTRGQLLSLLGLVMTAMIALGSTSFVSNAMAGIMLRSVNNFRPGDFIKIGEHAGRVSERGLFHTEIQTEDRDLTTLPNLYLVQQPVTVIRASGTIVSASISLGYDVPHEVAKTQLLEATTKAGLADSFVRVSELLDHAVLYRVYGFLDDSKKILHMRSKLREEILNTLHSNNIEITSPNHMYQRRLDDTTRAIPKKIISSNQTAAEEADAESIIFDKAEAAEKTETLRLRRDELRESLKTLQDDPANLLNNEKDIEKLQRNIDRLDAILAERANRQKEIR